MEKSPIQLSETQRIQAFANALRDLEEQYQVTLGVESKFKIIPKEGDKK